MLKKYKAAQLHTQIQILILVFVFIPFILLNVLLNIYHIQKTMDSVTGFATENIQGQSKYLTGYMKQYMLPFYSAAIDEKLIGILQDTQQERSDKSFRIFSALKEYVDSGNNEAVLLFLMETDGDGYLISRFPNRQVVVTENNSSPYRNLIEEGKSCMGNRELVTSVMEYAGENCVSVSHQIYDYKNQICRGSLTMLLYPNTLLEILGPSTDGYVNYALRTEDGFLAESENELYELEKSDVIKSGEEEVGWTNWTLVYEVDNRQIWWDNLTPDIIVGISIVVLFTLSFILNNFLMQRRMRTLRILEQAMERVQKEGEYVLLPLKDKNEMDFLFIGYNKMIQEIVYQRNKILEQNREKIREVKRQKEAEIRALELEINSHFIYNTLNSINYTAIENEDYETSDLLKAFANVLRYMTENRYGFVTVGQEIAWLEQYLFLQKSRFSGSFDFEIDVDSQIEDCKIRKLLLQPFVENAIIHGFDGKTRNGLITIICSGHENNELEFTIADNGYGIEESYLKKLRQGVEWKNGAESLGLGMANTCYRMKLYYGEAFKFTIESTKGTGTTVTLKLPMCQPGGNV